MMVNCPKCGFSQPDDQYCANCGVDMVIYRAKEKPARARFIANTAFQISILAAVALVGGLYVRATNKARADRMIAETPIARDVDEQESALATAQAEAAEARRQMNETNSASVGSPVAQAQAASAPKASNEQSVAPFMPSSASTTSPQVGTSTTAPAAGIRAALQPAQNVRVYFIEAQRAVLTELMNDARDGSGDGTMSYGVVANLDQRLKQMRGWQPLDSSPDQPMRLNKPNMVFKGMLDQASGQNIGLTVQVIPLARDEAGTHLQIDANRTLRDPASGIDSFNFQLPESFTIPKGGSFLMIGVLPHRSVSNDEQALYRSVNVLKPMTSEAFRSSNSPTDVAIIVEAR